VTRNGDVKGDDIKSQVVVFEKKGKNLIERNHEAMELTSTENNLDRSKKIRSFGVQRIEEKEKEKGKKR